MSATHSESLGTTSSESTVRVLLVDDHPIVREGYSRLISDEPDMGVCGEAEGMLDALREIERTHPHLAIVDVSLKDGSGLELIKEIRARFPNLKLLVASMHDESLYAERVLRAGGLGYVSKQEATDKLVDAIRHVLNGKVYLSEQMTNRMLCRSVGSENFSETSPIDTLSDRELEVFELIGQGVTTRQIADKLDLSPKTVETYRENIKSKLNLENATELTRHAVQWVLEEGGPRRESESQ